MEGGGGVRDDYDDGDRPVLDPYHLDAMCDGAHGAPLIRWPNRLGDGRYRFDGADHQVALTEPSTMTAIHGFLRWRPWRALWHSPDRVLMVTRVFPMPGYPFVLEVEVDYRFGADGLVVATTATNAGDQACPYGCGQHPYLSAGSATLDDCELELAANTRIVTDERQLPTGTQAVAGTTFDFRQRRRIGPLRVDFAFPDLARDESGPAWVRLWRPDGARVELWVDDGYPNIEIYTGDTLAAGRRRRGLGTEPMSCPPNAFQTGEQVIALRPGRCVTTRWGVRLRA
ncbi:MAG: aldose 1-epimerase family protein [Acidimicrobiales bacterium]